MCYTAQNECVLQHWLGHVKDACLRPRRNDKAFPSGTCVDVDTVCRRCPPQLASLGYLQHEEGSPAETDLTKVTQISLLNPVYNLNPAPLFIWVP